MLCRSCLRGAAARQSSTSISTSAPLRLASQSLRASVLQRGSRGVCSVPLTRTHLPQYFSKELRHTVRPAPRTFSSTASPPTSQTIPTTTSSTTAATLERPDYLNDAESQIWDMLAAEFAPVELVVQDISGGCGSMYGIEISSDKFRGANMLKQQRMVNSVLADLMKEWHGVQLKTRVPA